MPGRHHQGQTIAPVRLRIKAARPALGGHHPDFNLPGSHRLNDRRTGLLFEADPDTRMFTQEIAEIFG